MNAGEALRAYDEASVAPSEEFLAGYETAMESLITPNDFNRESFFTSLKYVRCFTPIDELGHKYRVEAGVHTRITLSDNGAFALIERTGHEPFILNMDFVQTFATL